MVDSLKLNALSVARSLTWRFLCSGSRWRHFTSRCLSIIQPGMIMIRCQTKALDEEKLALENKLLKIEKSEARYHKDAERRLTEMRHAEEEAQVAVFYL